MVLDFGVLGCLMKRKLQPREEQTVPQEEDLEEEDKELSGYKKNLKMKLKSKMKTFFKD